MFPFACSRKAARMASRAFQFEPIGNLGKPYGREADQICELRRILMSELECNWICNIRACHRPSHRL
jgi:hypothetical protein